jgi:cysteine desulfurase
MPVMPGHRIYLDHNATAPLAPGVREVVCAALDMQGNPSSVHREGRNARAMVEAARQQVAALAGVPASRIVFTSGATEAAALALTPQISLKGAKGFDILIVAGGEHPCVREGHRFAAENVVTVPLTAGGIVDLAALEKALDGLDGRRAVLALQAANNETGVIQPVRTAAEMVRAHGGIVVCDAVQAAHRIDENAVTLGADILFLSAHKMGGAKGVGAVALGNPALEIDSPLLRGGGQERSLRAGTENVAGIAGFGAAAVHALQVRASEATRQGALRDTFEAGLRELDPEITIFGKATPRLPNTTAFALPGMAAETLLIALDLEGIALSSGSACSSGKVRPSQVLESMGVPPELSRCALRASLGLDTTAHDIEQALETIGRVARRITDRRMKPAA